MTRRVLLPAAALAAWAALSFLAGCVQTLEEKSAPRSAEILRPVSGPGYVGVLFVPLDGFGRPQLGWVPDRRDVGRVEARLPELLAAAPPASFPDVAQRLSAYRRQYVGRHESGRRVLQVAFLEQQLIDERDLDWRSRRILIPDAGRRFFQLWYDLETDRVARFQTSSARDGV